MKKRWLVLVLLIFTLSNLNAGDIWLHMLTFGTPNSTYLLGDIIDSELYIQMEIGQEAWEQSEIGIGINSSGTGENWADASWYQNGDYPNKRVQRNMIDFQFTSIGDWYFYGRAISAGEPYEWHYANSTTWSNSSTLGATYYFTVNELNLPTFTSVVKNSTLISTGIDLSLSEDVDGHNVLIIRSKDSAVTWLPGQGTTYTDDQVLDTDVIVVRGSYDPSVSGTTLTDESLIPNTTYYYKIFSENWHYYSDGVEATTSYATTDALPQPSSVSATMLSDTKIKVEWTPNGNYGNVMVVAKKDGDLSDPPLNGTLYNVTDALGGGTVIYKGTESNYTYTGLDANSTYYFRVYTVDNTSNFYSANTSTNATTHDGTTNHTIVFTGSTTDFSSGENVGGNYYLTWDATYLYAAIFNGIDLLDELFNNKFAIAIDKDPGTANGYAPLEWGGYNFAANNDGTHNLEYIFIMGRGFTSLYNSGDSFVTAADKSSYTKQLGTYAEVRIPWAELGGRPTSDWEIIMWFSNVANDWMDSAWPQVIQLLVHFP